MLLPKFVVGMLTVGILWSALTGAFYQWLVIVPTIGIAFCVAKAVNRR